MIPSKTPKVLKHFFSTYAWDFASKKENTLYLTFDDGPIPEVTEFVLEQLSKYNAKATFFCIGDNIRKHPDIFDKIVAQEHAVGNHTMNHLKAWKTNSEIYRKNIIDCDQIIKKHVGNQNKPTLFRPPYGQISYSKFKVLEKLGYKIILWDVLSKDWEAHTSPESCLQNVLQNTEPGSIIVFHDSIKASKNLTYTLPKVLEYFTKKGFSFKAIRV